MNICELLKTLCVEKTALLKNLIPTAELNNIFIINDIIERNKVAPFAPNDLFK